MRCREQVYQMRVDEIKRNVSAIMKSATGAEFDPLSVFNDDEDGSSGVH